MPVAKLSPPHPIPRVASARLRLRLWGPLGPGTLESSISQESMSLGLGLLLGAGLAPFVSRCLLEPTGGPGKF